MPDADAFISPEPIRFMYDSDEDHVRAWLAWADQTPGGWRARLAERRRADVKVTSACCDAPVLLDPHSSIGRLGLCSVCGAMLDRASAGWEARGTE